VLMPRLLLLFGLVAGFVGCHRAEVQPPRGTSEPLAVRVAMVESGSMASFEEVVGTVAAKMRAVVEAKVNGRVEKLLVSPGQSVKAGELLAELEAKEIRARLEQAMPVREQTRRDLDRYEELRRKQAVPQQDYDAAESRFRVASAAVQEAETMLGYARVTAPFDGVVTRKLAEVGDQLAPGKPLLEMEDASALRVEAWVPEALAGRVRLGDRLSVRVDAVGRTLDGTVSEIAPSADPGTRTFLMKCDVAAEAGLRAGQFARVSVPVGDAKVLRVPLAAVVRRGQMEMVFAVQNGTARLRLVKTGRSAGGVTELLSGVEAGEKVVVSEPGRLEDGQPVRVEE
jgi:RND family efflux transporter MFP subunit